MPVSHNFSRMKCVCLCSRWSRPTSLKRISWTLFPQAKRFVPVWFCHLFFLATLYIVNYVVLKCGESSKETLSWHQFRLTKYWGTSLFGKHQNIEQLSWKHIRPAESQEINRGHTLRYKLTVWRVAAPEYIENHSFNFWLRIARFHETKWWFSLLSQAQIEFI